MAREFLKSHGVDLDNILANIQGGRNSNDPQDSGSNNDKNSNERNVVNIHDVLLPNKPADTTWDIYIIDGRISSIVPSDPAFTQDPSLPRVILGRGGLLLPSLCNPHMHLDKAYLLVHPRYSDLQVEKGDFTEAMEITSIAKSRFEEADLLERGGRVVDNSSAAGVTDMRAFVEIDAVVGTKCLEAGVKLKRQAVWGKTCRLQICAFAQVPLFSSSQGDVDGSVIRTLMKSAAGNRDVEVIGSTPYVENDREKMEKNVDWMIDLSIEFGKHLDFHLDYNLDAGTEPLLWFVLKSLKEKNWKEKLGNKTVVLGHCTRLTLFSENEWSRVKEEIGELPVFFVGLPTSDLFMMRTPDHRRGTLDIPHMIKEYGLNACIGVNNIGNAFTPQGSCDPLSLTCNGVGLYQAGTRQDGELLYECVSTRARRAIGLDGDRRRDDGDVNVDQNIDVALGVKIGDKADFVVYYNRHEDWRSALDDDHDEKQRWRMPKNVSELVYLNSECRGRRTLPLSWNGNETTYDMLSSLICTR